MSHLLLLFFIPAPPVRWGKHKGATGEGCRGSAWQDLWGICLCSLLMDGPTALLPRAHGLSPGRSDKNPSARKRLVWLCRAFPNTGLPRQGGWVTMGERGDRVSGECIPSCCLCSVWQGFPCLQESTTPWRRTGRCWNQCHPKGTTGAGHCLWLCRPGVPSSHTLRGSTDPHRMELDTRLLPVAHPERNSPPATQYMCWIFTPARGAQGTLLQSPTTL